jgi:hypothetical protein
VRTALYVTVDDALTGLAIPYAVIDCCSSKDK